MMDTFDVLLIDLQDLGCRIYTFITTLRYMLEAAATYGKSVWILDRPNPAGRPVEGACLAGWLGKFCRRRPLTDAPRLDHGRARARFVAALRLDVDCHVVDMLGWDPDTSPEVSAGHSANAPGLTPARTRRTCRWPAATPER